MKDLINSVFLPSVFNFFFLLTPFFVLNTFLAETQDVSAKTKRILAVRITIGVAGICLLMFLGGSWLMRLFGITVDAYRAGAGVLLILMAIRLVEAPQTLAKHYNSEKELLQSAIVPLAIPVTAGPATLGTMVVLGLEEHSIEWKFATCLAIVIASILVGIMLLFADLIQRGLGRSNVALLSKITGLVLCAIAVQMIVVGVRALWLN